MRSDDTKAITITLPKALFERVHTLAGRDHCGNVSAVIRGVLYKEVGLSISLELKEDDRARIEQVEARTEKYRINRLRKKEIP